MTAYIAIRAGTFEQLIPIRTITCTWNCGIKAMSGLAPARLDVTNKSQANNTWQDYVFDVPSIAHKRSVRVAFVVATDNAYATTFYVDNVYPMVRHLVPDYHGKNWAATKVQPRSSTCTRR